MLGIDVSKDNLVCALRDKDTRKVLWDLTVPNDKEGIQTLLEKTSSETPWVLEPTGKFSLFVVSGKTKFYLKELRNTGKVFCSHHPEKRKHF